MYSPVIQMANIKVIHPFTCMVSYEDKRLLPAGMIGIRQILNAKYRLQRYLTAWTIVQN